MKTLDLVTFQRRCLSLLSHLDAAGIIVTKNGRPIAHITPAMPSSRSMIGALRGKLRVNGEIGSTDLAWRAAR